MKFMSVYHGTGAEKLRKAAFERFERLKKTCMLKDALQPSQEELQESAKGFKLQLISDIFTMFLQYVNFFFQSCPM